MPNTTHNCLSLLKNSRKTRTSQMILRNEKEYLAFDYPNLDNILCFFDNTRIFSREKNPVTRSSTDFPNKKNPPKSLDKTINNLPSYADCTMQSMKKKSTPSDTSIVTKEKKTFFFLFLVSLSCIFLWCLEYLHIACLSCSSLYCINDTTNRN